MKVYQLERTQVLPLTMEEAWDFFSNPVNLKEITPPEMGFKILFELKSRMYPGQMINYIVKPMLNIPMRWTTEITQVVEPEFFVDEQRFGPYAMWHHEHFFRPVAGGVETRDLVHYALPLGFLGRIAHTLFVRKKLDQIFDYRFETLEARFGKVRAKAPAPTDHLRKIVPA